MLRLESRKQKGTRKEQKMFTLQEKKAKSSWESIKTLHTLSKAVSVLTTKCRDPKAHNLLKMRVVCCKGLIHWTGSSQKSRNNIAFLTIWKHHCNINVLHYTQKGRAQCNKKCTQRPPFLNARKGVRRGNPRTSVRGRQHRARRGGGRGRDPWRVKTYSAKPIN